MAGTSELKANKKKQNNPDQNFVDEVLKDFKICCESREASLIARKEVLTGKAKFGIVGDGKEVPQVAMARAFKKGDWRSGYYRDQTFHFALGLSSLEAFFAQLYADAENDPFSGGRQMNCHFATPMVDQNGNWLNLKEMYNVSSDISSTGGQMARALGLALASKKYREINELSDSTAHSQNGNEVVFCTIGDASTSEGVFWEAMNAAAVLKVPMVVSVWDDGYGISVPTRYQTTKGNISEALEGFRINEDGNGMDILEAFAWDYPGLCDLYEKAVEKTRRTHIPCLIHVKEVTQPQGHSTSGSHERYKSKERLQWETEHDCIKVMADWIVNSGIATSEQLEEIQENAKQTARQAKSNAWAAYNAPIKTASDQLDLIFKNISAALPDNEKVAHLSAELKNLLNPHLSEVAQIARRMHFELRKNHSNQTGELEGWLIDVHQKANARYHTHLYSNSSKSALKIPAIAPEYSQNSETKNGFEVLNAFFDKAFERYPNFIAFGEDVGFIGGVNQAFAGMQAKYGEERIFDTGIREWTIMGQAIGMAMRGLRPIGEIQYLDYLIFGLEPLNDDLSTLRWRSNGQQQAPAIVRTRGHRLEGIWHAGSPLGMIINSLRGMWVCVPRNFVQAAGMYNTLLQSDDPALLIECLNGYRLKEKLPDNIGDYTVPLGVPEVLRAGSDVTLVTYGSCVRVAAEACQLLEAHGISVELIDVQTLLPFDLEHQIAESLKKTNRIVFLDEDVPGGATAFMMKKVLEDQGGYRFLDSEPKTITAAEHRPPYGSDGDYFSKPNPEDIFEIIYEMMREAFPAKF